MLWGFYLNIPASIFYPRVSNRIEEVLKSSGMINGFTSSALPKLTSFEPIINIPSSAIFLALSNYVYVPNSLI